MGNCHQCLNVKCHVFNIFALTFPPPVDRLLHAPIGEEVDREKTNTRNGRGEGEFDLM